LCWVPTTAMRQLVPYRSRPRWRPGLPERERIRAACVEVAHG
jgi:hypothetical protein